MSVRDVVRDGETAGARSAQAPAARPPAAAPAHARVLALQQAAGNRAVVRALHRRPRTYLGTDVPVASPQAEGRTVGDETEEAIDPIATAGRVRAALDAAIERDDAELRRLRGLGRLDDAAEESARRERIRELSQDLATARRDRGTLDRGHLSIQRLERIALRNELMVEPAVRSSDGSGSSSTVSVTATGLGHTTTTTRTVGAPGATTRERSESTTWSTESGRTHTSTQTRTTDDVAAGTSERRRRSTTTTTDLSSHTRTRERSTRRTDATGASSETSERTTRSVSGGNGRVTWATSTQTRQETTTASGDTTSVQTTRGRSTSAVHGESGSGVAHERSIERTTTTAGGLEVVRRASADGRVTVNLARDSDDPSKWRVTFAFHLGGSARGGASRAREGDEAGYRAGGSLTAQAGADLTVTRVMTEAELVRRLGVDVAAIASGRDSADREDVGLEARVRALFGNFDAFASSFANFSAGSARGLAEGESVELSAYAGGDLSLSGGHQGSGSARTRGSFGVTVSAGATRTRAARVERKDGKIVVTITLTAEERGTLGATVGYGLASGGLEGTGTDSGARAIAFELDPGARDFTARFDELRFAVTAEQLQHFAAAHPSLVQSRTNTDTRTRGTTTTAGVAGVSLGINDSSTTSHEVTRGRASGGGRQLTGTMTGSRTTGADLSVAGTRVLRGSTTSQARGSVDESGDLTVGISQSQDETDLAQSVEDAAERLETRDTVDNIADIASQGLGGYLRSIAERTYSRLSGYDLTPAEVAIVVQRAADESKWGRGVASPRYYFAWMDLRRVLVDPRPPADWIANDSTPGHRAAKNLFRAQALADFMAEAGDDGYNGVVYVLRYWGNYGFTDVGSQDIGAMYEWPPSLSRTRARYTSLRGRAQGISSQLSGLGAGQRERGHALCEELSSGLGQVLREIDASTDFEEPRAKLELMGTVRGLIARVSAARRNFDRRLDRAASTQAPAGTTAPQQTAADEQAAARRVEAETNRDALLAQLPGFKAQERRLLQAARENLPASAGGTLREEGWGGFVDGFSVSGNDAMEHISRLTEVDEQWIRVIRNLRDAYRALGVPESQWAVSSGPESARRRDKEPDIETLKRLFVAAGDRIQFYWSVGDRNQLIGNYDRMMRY